MHLRTATGRAFAYTRHFNKHLNWSTTTTTAFRAQATQHWNRRYKHEEAHAKVVRKLRDRQKSNNVFDNFLIVDTLRESYPDHLVTQTRAATELLKLVREGSLRADLDKSVEYYSSREKDPDYESPADAGLLYDKVEFGRYNCHWDGHEFYIYEGCFPITEYETIHNHYIVFPRADGGADAELSKTVDDLLTAALEHDEEVSEEIWLYDAGYWSKNHKLWKSVAKFTFDQIILNESLKKEITEDVMSFFDQKQYYASFGVPWKRGLIFHGLPGNGKTLSIKALMQALSSREKPIPTLYVKSFGRRTGQDDIRDIFSKARDTAPCLLVFEDLDSLVSDSNRSFFLNEIDGIEQNDGIMMIGSTNHLDKLDVGISKRPSRFDRKYHFPLPAMSERTRYCDLWRSKLSSNKQLDFPAELSAKIAGISEGLSFAYLQEIFIASMTTIIRNHENQQGLYSDTSTSNNSTTTTTTTTPSSAPADLSANEIWQAVSKQIEKIRKEMRDSRKSILDNDKNSVLSDASSGSVRSAGFGP